MPVAQWFGRGWMALAMGLAPAGAMAAGHPQKLPPHHAPHPAIISTLQDTGPMEGAAAGLARVYGGTPVDVLTYHYDAGRTGWNQSETDLTPATVGSKKFGLLTTLHVDGNVFAQPLLVTGFTMPDGSTHDVLVIATGHDSVYAYDAQSYALLWHVSLGRPQSSTDVGCSDVEPDYGISGTPVILRASAGAATIYLVAATEPRRYQFVSQLHALDVGSGADVTPPVTIAPSATLSDGTALTYDPQNQWTRASLAAGSGSIYVPVGSHCDHNSGAISGWLLRYSPALAPMSAFHTIGSFGPGGLASIWMTGFAPALDAKGDLFAVTGNGGTALGVGDWGESALSLDPTLTTVRSRFTPDNYPTLNDYDVDFGSGGIMLLPVVGGQTAPPMAVAMGKAAILYLLNQKNLGGLKPHDHGALQAIVINSNLGSGIWGGPAYYGSPVKGPTVYVQTDSDVLRAFSVATTGTPGLTASQTGTTDAGYGGSLPIVSSNGAAAGTGVVWLIRRTAPIELEAYDADRLGAPIFAANAGGAWSNPGNNNPFLTPMEADGRVYVPGYRTVKVFGLKP